MTRSYVSYDQDSDTYSVKASDRWLGRDGTWVRTYQAKGRFIRERFIGRLPRSGDELARAIVNISEVGI